MKCVQPPNPHPYSTAGIKLKFIRFPWCCGITSGIYTRLYVSHLCLPSSLTVHTTSSVQMLQPIIPADVRQQTDTISQHLNRVGGKGIN